MTFETLELPVKSNKTPNAMTQRPSKNISKIVKARAEKRTILGSKVAIFCSDVLELTAGRVQDLNIAGQIFFTPDFTEAIKARQSEVNILECFSRALFGGDHASATLTVRMQFQKHRAHGCL